MATSSWAEPVTTPFKPGFPGWFKGILDHCLQATIYDDGDSERPQLAVCFWYVDPFCWLGFPEGVVGEGIDHSPSGCWRFNHQFIHSRHVFPSVDLCYSSDTY